MAKNNILYDLTATQPFGKNLRHGGGKYGEVIFKRIVERGLPVSGIYDSKRWLNPEVQSLIEQNGVRLIDINSDSIENIVKNNNIGTIYTALNSSLYNLKNVRIVGTIHGLRRLETPCDSIIYKYKNISFKDFTFYFCYKYFYRFVKNRLRAYYLKEWANPSFDMITVSNHTSKAIKVFFPEMKNKEIPVFYSPSTSYSELNERKYEEKFFLIVSCNRLEKNNLRAIIALDELFSNGSLEGFHVKITGAKDANNFRYSIKNPNRFSFLGFVDDAELEQLYHDAYCLIYPSLNEGFGYPPLEAMHYGVPVISSPFASITEICQDANLYFNPFSIEEISNRILQIESSIVHEQQSTKARERYRIVTNKQKIDLDNLIDYIYK